MIHTGIGRGGLQRVEMRLEVENESLKIFGSGCEVCFLIVTASFIVQRGDNDVPIDRFAATCTVLQNPLGFCQVNKRLLDHVLID